jgi:3-oxoacyl-[acyl-carrier-protein] synthase-3
MNKFYFPEIKKREFDRQCRIIATGSAFPDTVVTNADIITKYNHSITDIAVQKTIGVKERRVASDGIVDSDLLCQAATVCLTNAGIRPEQLSKLIVNKFIGDKALPMTAS